MDTDGASLVQIGGPMSEATLGTGTCRMLYQDIAKVCPLHGVFAKVVSVQVLRVDYI